MNYLRLKHCAICLIRLDKVDKKNIRRAKEKELIALNNIKPNILKKIDKPVNDTVIKSEDLICKRCMSCFKNMTSK